MGRLCPTLCLMAVFALAGRAQTPAPDPPPRVPAFALKTERTLRSNAEIARARANAARYPGARRQTDAILQRAAPWLEWDDGDLMALLTPARIPRAFNESAEGCPQCGRRIFEVGGTYPWIVDLKQPFRLKCPVDGSVYPSNDFNAWYRSGFTEQKGWDTDFVDDGWGWVSPSGERHWFVAHWNHEMWYRHLIPGLSALGQAYLLTGDARYAHKAAVILTRMAEVYPAMDHEKQSRYGAMMAARGIRYPGKIVNAIWESGVATIFANAYDAVWETLDADTALHALTGRDGPALRAFIEANLLEEAVDAYHQRKIAGNFGMAQTALITLGVARQHPDLPRFMDEVMRAADVPMMRLGLRYAFYNLIDRNGIPPESGPGYNALWVSKIADLAPLFQKAGVDLFAHPKAKRLWDGTLDIVNAGAFTPSLGDSGSVTGDPAFTQVAVFEPAARAYRNNRFRGALAEGRARGAELFSRLDSLFQPPPNVGAPLPPQRSRLLDGTGLAILNNPADTISLTLTYGLKAGHGHYDRLSFEMFGAGQPLMPDLGYPDAMNDFVSGIYTWSKNTVSHNTVVVDARRQSGNVMGRVNLFADAPFARAVDVAAEGTYPQTSAYRRTMVMVDADAERSYFVDVFAVRGGKDHLYSLHGPPGPFAALGGRWTPQSRGTLAGEAVEEGAIYDNPAMAAPGYAGGFNSYAGSGFQHLTNVRVHEDGGWVGQWAHAKDPGARLRIRVMDQPGQKVMLAEARVSPVQHPERLTYVLARREGDAADGRFVSVLEPYRETPFIEDAQLLPLDSGEGVAVAVRRKSATDIIIVGEAGSTKTLAAHGLSTDARVAVVTLDGAKGPTRVFFAGSARLRVAGRAFHAPPAAVGVVSAVDPKAGVVRVRLDAPLSARAAKEMEGRVVHFRHRPRQVAHPVASARLDGDNLVLTVADDLLIGCIPVADFAPDRLRTKTPMPFAPTYAGAWVADAGLTTYRRIKGVSDGEISLAQPMPMDRIRAGDDAWVVSVGPGDRLDVPQLFAWSATAESGTGN